MSNINDTNTDFLTTIADSFFTWFHNDILPVCFAVFDILVIIIGTILNVLLIVTFKQRGLFNDASSHIVFVLIISDFLSYVFLLLPNVISAIATTWILSHPVCEFQGSMIFILMFVNLAFVTVLSIERTIKLCRADAELYEKVFESKTVRNVIVVLVWLLAVSIGFIPVSGAGNIKYDFYHQGCMLDYEENFVFLIIHFLLTVVVSSITVIACYSLIFNIRRKTLIKNRLENFKKVNKEKGRNTINSDISGNSLPTIAENEDDVSTEEEKGNAFEKKDDRGTSKGKVNTRKGRPRSSPRQSLLFEVFSDDEENPAFHLAITYIALWGTIMVFYLPYVVVSFYDTFNSGPLWGGCYSVAILLMHTCFAVKPIVYLGHNRHYRHVTKQTIPEGMRNRARSMRTSVSSMSETLEDLVFRSNSHAKFRAALSTQKAVLIWKKRWQKKKGIFKLKEERNVSPNPPLQTTTGPVENSKEIKPKVPPGESTNLNVGRTSVTPSGVVLSTTPSTTYIEDQRQKLLGGQAKTVRFGQLHQNNTSTHNGTSYEKNVSPVPGMVNDNLEHV